jgi:hypothetical protein
MGAHAAAAMLALRWHQLTVLPPMPALPALQALPPGQLLMAAPMAYQLPYHVAVPQMQQQVGAAV